MFNTKFYVFNLFTLISDGPLHTQQLHQLKFILIDSYNLFWLILITLPLSVNFSPHLPPRACNFLLYWWHLSNCYLITLRASPRVIFKGCWFMHTPNVFMHTLSSFKTILSLLCAFQKYCFLILLTAMSIAENIWFKIKTRIETQELEGRAILWSKKFQVLNMRFPENITSSIHAFCDFQVHYLV